MILRITETCHVAQALACFFQCLVRHPTGLKLRGVILNERSE